MVIVNKPEAGSMIGIRQVHNANPDGYTVGMAAVTLITSRRQGLMPYDHHDYTLMGASCLTQERNQDMMIKYLAHKDLL